MASHFKLIQPVKIDGIDFETGVYPIDEIDAGRRTSIVNAGWGDYCDAPKSKPKTKTDDDEAGLADPDLDEVDTLETRSVSEAAPAKPKPARSRKKQPAK